MSTVIMKRGDDATMRATTNVDGLIYFNSDDNSIYLFDGTNRTIYGGKTQLLSSLSGETNANAYSALAVKNNYVKTSAYNQAMNGINTNISRLNTQIINTQGQLKVDSTTFYFDYQDGKWGFNTSSNRGADTFHPFNSTNLTIDGSDISATIASLDIKESVTTSDTNISINFMRGTAERTFCSAYYGLGLFGDAVHIFDDYYGHAGSSNGTHEHYVFDTAWHKSTSAPSPLKTLESNATIGLPFVINKLVASDNPTYPDYNYRIDDLYFYVCVSNQIKVYKYTMPNSPQNTYSGTWELVNKATYTLSNVSTISNYAIGAKGCNVVYNNQLYIFGGTYTQSGATQHDNNIYVWNPVTQLWSVKTMPNNMQGKTIYGAVAHNNKVYLMFSDYTIGIYEDNSCEIITPDIDTALRYDSMTSFVEYNSQIHWLGSSAYPKNHVVLQEYKNSNNEYIYNAYQTTDLKYNFKEGCAIVTYPCEAAVHIDWDETHLESRINKVIRCLGTSQANTDTYSYRKYNRTLQDIYVGNICNSDNCLKTSTI